ncbi:MAG TPA: thiamine pyrophosphate-dependent enzyme [Acidimicrobiales bacterium]|nr:thiamine pyrophosphate-dependent enzyme [Acidimicrobiales bacterium]
MKGRDQAIREILGRHGHDAVYVASTGYISRAVFAEAGGGYNVFYMQGSMGLAPAIGLGMALNASCDVVVINGDASLLMSLGTTHTVRESALTNLFHYVLDNGCHESVGGQPCAVLEESYPGVTEVVKITRDGRPPRVSLTVEANSDRIRDALGDTHDRSTR